MSKLKINEGTLYKIGKEPLNLQKGLEVVINNPHIRVVDELKRRNVGNEKIVAGEYFGSKYSYQKTFKMIIKRLF